MLELYFRYFAVIVFSLCLGSFATALTWRVPEKIPWALPDKNSKHLRSSCTQCKTTLKALDLIPVLSFLMYRGRCRYCKKSIKNTYLYIELITVAMGLLVYFLLGLSWTSLVVFAAIPFLVALFFIDLKHFILPNQIVAILGVLGVFYHFTIWLSSGFSAGYNDEILFSICGALFFAAIVWFLGFLMSQILKKDSLGFGDVKFFAVAGLWLGIQALPHFMILSGVIGVLYGVIYTKVFNSKVFPFGPALIITFFVGVLLRTINPEWFYL